MIGRRARQFLSAALLSWLYLFSPALAQDAGIRVDANRRELSVGETVRIVVQLVNLQGSSIQPELPDAFEIEGQNSQTSMSMSFGQDTQMTISQVLLARAVKAGKYTIGPFRLKVRGKNYESNSLEMVVHSSSTQPQSGSSPQGGVGSAPVQNDSATGPDPRRPVALLADVSHKNPWQHERFDYILRFYYRGAVANPKLQEGDVSAFDSYDGKEPRQREYQASIQGVPYHVVEIRRQMSARKGGKVVIPAARLSVDVRGQRERRQRDPDDPFSAFDDMFEDSFFSGRMERVTIASQPLTLDVKTLPEPRPAGWTQAVGSVALSHDLSKAQLSVGESATLTIKLEGKADLASALSPDLKVEGIKAYPDKPSLDRRFEPNGEIVDTRVFKIGLVPVKPGTIILPPIVFSYFNTSAGRYEELVVPSQTLQVSVGVEDGSATSPGLSGTQSVPVLVKKEVRIQGTDILPIKDDLVAVVRDGQVDVIRILCWFAFPFLALFVWLGLVVRDLSAARSGIMSPATRARKALAAWAKARRGILGKAAKSLNDKDVLALYGELTHAAKAYVGARGNANGTAMTPEEVASFLGQHGIPVDKANSLRDKLARAEMCQFVASEGSKSGFVTLVDECDSLLREIEKEWP